MSIASVCVLVSCLIMTGSAVLFSANVQSVVDTVQAKNETTFYFEKNLSRPEGVMICKDIAKMDNVESAEYYSKDKGLKTLKKLTGEDIYDDLKGEKNPLPDAVKVVMKDPSISAYDKTVKKILAVKGVDRVTDHRSFVKRLTNINNVVQILSIVIIAALGIISLFIISNTIRATMFSRRSIM